MQGLGAELTEHSLFHFWNEPLAQERLLRAPRQKCFFLAAACTMHTVVSHVRGGFSRTFSMVDFRAMCKARSVQTMHPQQVRGNCDIDMVSRSQSSVARGGRSADVSVWQQVPQLVVEDITFLPGVYLDGP